MYHIDKRYLLVDGYNYINQDSQCKRHLEVSLETARLHLNNAVSEYCAYSGEIGIVVYDATKSNKKKQHIETYKNIKVIFTKSKQTADSYIEKYVADLLKDKTNQVRVITQDWAEQLVVLGSGGLRVSAREWQREIKQMKRRLPLYNTIDNAKKDRQIGEALDKKTLKKLELFYKGDKE